MILPSMTPEEKVKQMQNLFPYIHVHADEWLRCYNHTFFRTKRFPACYSSEVDFSEVGMGKWTMHVIAESKSNLKKGVATIRMYQTYYVTHAKEQSNNGTGIYELVANDDMDVSCHEYTPHYFNRLRQRMIAPRGIVQPSFPELVRRMTCDHWSSMDETITGFRYKKDETGKYALVEDHNDDRQEGYDNLVSYHPDGISLGVSAARRRYFLYLSYVSNDLLYPGQVEKQKKRLQELLGHQYELRNNPFATFSRKAWEPKET